MKVKIHKLFEYLLETTTEEPEAIIGFSLSESPKLGDFLDDLDPDLSLDWNQKSFRGLPELRHNVLVQASLENPCKLDNVLITAGAAEANYLTIMQLIQPGDEMIIETPGWPQATVLGKAIGADIKTIKRHEEDNWQLPLERLKELVTPQTKLIFLTNPNNPTGRLFSTEELNEIVSIASSVGAWLLVDEVYAGLEWVGSRAPSVAGLYDRGITTGSVSKALGLQGLRTGWLICQDSTLMMDALILRENSSEIMNVMGEVIAEIALRPERLKSALAKARADGQKHLDQLDEFVHSQDRLSWVRPQAGLIGLAKLADGMDGEKLARRLLAPPYKTFLLPGIAYNQPQHIRLGVGGGAGVDFELGLNRLSDLLDNWE